jgi:cell wall-associated NlpC family hydrolase
MTEIEERDLVDRVARSWISTPFHDFGMVKGPSGGVDCATLIACVLTEAGLIPPVEIKPYSPQFFLNSDEEVYLSYVIKHAHEIPQEAARHGDVVLYRIGKCYAHGAIIVKPGWPNIVHAHFGSRCVRRGSGDAVHLGTPILGRKFFSRWGA